MSLVPGLAGSPELLLKTVPPRLPEYLLARERLGTRNPRWCDAPFALVQAPAGFGKTMLLAQWRREHLAAGRVVAWVSAQSQDTPARLVQALAWSVRESAARPAFGRDLLERPVAGPMEAATAWLAELAQAALEVVLVVDEAQQLSPASVELLGYVLRNAPPNLRAVVAARSGCEAGLDDLIDYGRCAVLGPALLRFELGETIALLRHRLGDAADAELAARVHELADGWPLGLQLALTGASSPAELRLRLAAPGGQHGAWRERLAELLLSRLEPADLALLVNLSCADELHPALCTALGGDEAAARVQRLVRETPVFATADHGGWLRMHALVREILQRRFAALPQAQRGQLHERAAQWLAAQAQPDAAAAHALAAGREDLAAELVEHSLNEALIRQHRPGSALEWISRLPAEQLDRRPRLLLMAAWGLSAGERHEGAVGLVDRLLALPGADAAMRCECDLILSNAAIFQDDPDRVAQLYDRWGDAPALRSPMLRQVHANRGAYRATVGGDPALARLRLRRAPPLDGGWSLAAVGRWTNLGYSHYVEGRVDLADEVLAPVLAEVERHTGWRSPFAAMLAAARAAALVERGAVAEAEALLAHRLDVVERAGLPEVVVLSFTTLARAAAVQGQAPRALQLLEGLHAVGVARGLPRLCIASLAEQVRLHAPHERAELCAAMVGRIDALVDGAGLSRGPLWRLHAALPQALAQGCVALAARQWQRAAAALARAEALALQLGDGRLRLVAMGLRALALEQAGERGSRTLLREAADTARSLGLVRTLPDAHPALASLLRETVAWSGPGLPVQAPAPPPAAPAARLPASQALTPKEREVLALLAGNLTNREIGLALAVSAETVKWHVKNLLLKLNATTRRQVVQRARMLGMLE